MEDKYDASGYGWDDEDKLRELTEKGTRFLVAREMSKEEGRKVGAPVGFVHFRFTVQGEVIDQMAGDPSLHIYDIHVEEESQRKGLGKHLLLILELVARREKMKLLSLPVQLGDNETTEWIRHIGKGWAVDESMAGLGFDADVEVRSSSPNFIQLFQQPPPHCNEITVSTPYHFLQGFHVYSKVLGELTKRAPTITAAPVAAKPAAAAATTAPAESVFKVTAPSAAGAANVTTVASPTDSVDEVDDGWVCL